MSTVYLERYASKESPFFTSDLELNFETRVIVVIPCYKEPDLLTTLSSLKDCYPGKGHTEVFIVINEPEGSGSDVQQANKKTSIEANEWISKNKKNHISFHTRHVVLDKKNAGVGLARKIGMDDAVRYFEKIGRPTGLVLCYDADSTCSTNYLQAVSTFFVDHPKCIGASIHFEHPLDGVLPNSNYLAITNYELFLRYYINALKYAGFPYAHQTIGSSMCVRADIYQKQGGMNKRKAGEDFYFLNKIIPLGEFGEITNTTVIPSPRSSDRVPFGTGRDIDEQISSANLNSYLTYDYRTFIDLKVLIDNVYKFEQSDDINWLPLSIQTFLGTQNFLEGLKKIRSQSNSRERFIYKFYEWFNAFRVLKYVHFSRDNHYPNIELSKACSTLCNKWFSIEVSDQPSIEDYLLALRRYDKGEKSVV